MSSNPIPAKALLLLQASFLAVALLLPYASQSQQGLKSPPSGPDPVTARKMHDAIAFAQAGDAPQALRLVDSLLAAQPRFLSGLKLRGMLLEDMGRNPEALAAYSAVLALAPADPDMLLKVGTIELLTGHLDRATELLEHRLRLIPGDEEASYYLAQAEHLQGRNDHALQVLHAAIVKGPGTAALWQKYGELLVSAGQDDQALPWLLKAQQADPSLPRIDFDLAVASYAGMDLQKAAVYAAREARAEPRDIDNLMLLATVQIKLANWTAADANLQRVVEARPNDAPALVALGQCELELKRFPSAVDALQRALQADPTQVLAHFFLSRAYAGLGDTAVAQHEAALHREMQQHLTFTLTKDEQRRQDAVLNRARELLKNSHESDALALLAANDKGPGVTEGSAWVSLGATYLSLGNNADAQRCFEHALTLAPKTPDARTYLGYLALQQGDLNRAEPLFQAEIARDASHAFATAELGEVHYRRQQWQPAVELITRSKTTDPTLLYMLCDAFFHLGKPQQAILIAETLSAYARTQPAIAQPLDKLLRGNNQAALADRLASTAGPPTPGSSAPDRP